MSMKPVLLGLTALLLAGPVLAQSSVSNAEEPGAAASRVPTAPSAVSTPSTPGSAASTAATPRADTRRDGTRMLGGGAFNTSTGLEGVLNTGTPSMYDRKSGPRKVCPPGLENRNNVCVPPIDAVLSN